MNHEKFLRSAKEIYSAVTTFCDKGEDDSFGNWRFVNSELKNGDSQIVIYRRITEINLVRTQLKDKSIEVFFKINRVADDFVYEALKKYVKDNKLDPIEDNSTVYLTLFFDGDTDFSIFIHKYLLANI